MISNRCHYALKAVLELAKHEGQGLVTISQIAGAQSIPSRFLEAILVQLKQNGYAQSVRGKDGGYSLARPARDISVREIVALFENPIFAIRTSAKKRPAKPDVFAGIWEEANDTVSKVLGGVHFDKLAAQERRNESSGENHYVI